MLKTDRRGVYSAYAEWPKMARMGFGSKADLRRLEFRRAFVMGMGGSAAGGDILASWLAGRGRAQLSVFKGQLPPGDLGDALAIACSVSGQTEETIRMMKEAVARGATVVSMSSGGTLQAEAKKRKVPHVAMPRVLAPRYNLPFMVFACLSLLNDGMGLRCAEDARESFSEMNSTWKDIGVDSPASTNPSKALALRLMNGTPVIYGSRVTRGVGIRFKNVLNENAKKHAHFDIIPDAFHNDVESWEDPSVDFRPVFLRHSEEDKRDAARTDAMSRLLAKAGKSPAEVRGRGKSSLSEIVTMVYILDMVSYYVAIGLGRDPFPVRLIERLKKF
ncbi:MAG: hypothetical protein HY296_00895 [Thaumarchaeota archaeon]|nr:hypothetical protein [Nitrososphaerota archaeon]